MATGDAPSDSGGIGNLGQLHDEAVEIVVVMIELVIMMGAAVIDVVLDGKPEPKQDRRVDLSERRRHNLHRTRKMPADEGNGAFGSGVVEQIALRHDDEIGAGDLILEHLLDRVVVVERVVRGSLRLKRLGIRGDMAVGKRGPVNHGDHAVDRDPAADRGPLEGLHQRFGQGQAGGLDQYVLDLRLARQDLEQDRRERVADERPAVREQLVGEHPEGEEQRIGQPGSDTAAQIVNRLMPRGLRPAWVRRVETDQRSHEVNGKNRYHDKHSFQQTPATAESFQGNFFIFCIFLAQERLSRFLLADIATAPRNCPGAETV